MALDWQIARLSKILVDSEGITFDEAQARLRALTLEGGKVISGENTAAIRRRRGQSPADWPFVSVTSSVALISSMSDRRASIIMGFSPVRMRAREYTRRRGLSASGDVGQASRRVQFCCRLLCRRQSSSYLSPRPVKVLHILKGRPPRQRGIRAKNLVGACLCERSILVNNIIIGDMIDP